MDGQAVVDLDGKDYNDGKGTLKALMADPAKAEMFKHLRDARGEWTVRDDVWVRFQREGAPLLAGPLGFGFSVYGDRHHFGPELQFGHIVGDYLENPVLLIKTAWGGKSLYKDFRPPSSGGEVGPYYKKMIASLSSVYRDSQMRQRRRCRPNAGGQVHPLVRAQAFLKSSSPRLLLCVVRLLLGLRFFLLPVIADDAFQGAD